MPKRKLTDDDIAELLNLRATGTSLNDLAVAFDISAQHAGRIVRAAKGCIAEDAVREPLTVREAEEFLAKAVRKGSVGALKLWFDRHDHQQSPAGDDPLLDFLPRSHGGRG